MTRLSLLFPHAHKILLVLVIAVLGMATVTTDDSKYFEISKNIEIFTNLYKEINTFYVDEIDPARLMRTGIDAMLESLDPYTNYISESEIEGFRYITEGKYNGIGAIIKKIGDYITITEPYDNCPAQKAGLKAGDVIKAIDGKSAKDKTSDGIRVNAIAPGEIETSILSPGTEGMIKDIPLRRLGDTNEVADTIFYLCSDAASYVNGAEVHVNGGQHV